MVEDHAQIFVDYNGNIQEFNREVMEKGLDYHKKNLVKPTVTLRRLLKSGP